MCIQSIFIFSIQLCIMILNYIIVFITLSSNLHSIAVYIYLYMFGSQHVMIYIRWFRLEAGELSYYTDDSYHVNKQKRVILLKDCQLDLDSSDTISCIDKSIILKLPNTHVLLMEANTVEDANQWRGVISDSISILERVHASNKEYIKSPRLNLTDATIGMRNMILETKREVGVSVV